MSVSTQPSGLTSGRLLARNTIWSLLGQLLPMAAAIVCVPALVHGLGVARFGVLSLAWIVIGYFSLFDLGIGRAVTKLVADRLGAGRHDSIPPLVWTASLLMLLLGVFGGLVTLEISPWLVQRALKIPQDLQAETLSSFYLLAASIPLVTLTSGLRGVLEAQQRFGLANLIRVPLSIFSFAGPLLVLPFSHSLVPVVLVLVAGRIVALAAHLLACFYAMPALRHNFALRRSEAGPLLRFGGWITASNILGPIVAYIDRFFIGVLLSVTAFPYYPTPLDMVGRLTVIPGPFAAGLFPAFAVSLLRDPERASLLLSRALKYTLLAIFPIVLVIVVLAPEILRLWLGVTFMDNSSLVLRWLAAGVFINCFGQVPFAFVQSAGRPDLTAKMYVIELPAYLGLIWFLTRRYGIEGAAIAWTVRVALDAVLLFLFTWRLLPQKPKFLTRLAAAVTLGMALFYLGTLPHSLAVRSTLLLAVLLVFAVMSWVRGLGSHERVFLRSAGTRKAGL
jgi:O-antigen/teichoic acid export membrane protein